MYWLPPSAVKQSGNATITGGILRSWIRRAARSGTFSSKLRGAVCMRPVPVKPTRSNSTGNRAPRPLPRCWSYCGGSQTSSNRTCGSPSGLSVRTFDVCSSVTTRPPGHFARLIAMEAPGDAKAGTFYRSRAGYGVSTRPPLWPDALVNSVVWDCPFPVLVISGLPTSASMIGSSREFDPPHRIRRQLLPGVTLPGPVHDARDVARHQHRRAARLVDDGRRAHGHRLGRRLRSARRGRPPAERAHVLYSLQVDRRRVPALYGLANVARRAVAPRATRQRQPPHPHLADRAGVRHRRGQSQGLGFLRRAAAAIRRSDSAVGTATAGSARRDAEHRIHLPPDLRPRRAGAERAAASTREGTLAQPHFGQPDGGGRGLVGVGLRAVVAQHVGRPPRRCGLLVSKARSERAE